MTINQSDVNLTSNVCIQLYTVSQDGTLCVWESDTEPSGLVLKKSKTKPSRQGEGEGEDDEEGRVEGEEGEVIRGKAETPKETGKTKNVRYKLSSK